MENQMEKNSVMAESTAENLTENGVKNMTETAAADSAKNLSESTEQTRMERGTENTTQRHAGIRSDAEAVRQLTSTAMMAALVFVATYAIRIPNPATGGYSHMGDCMVFLGAYLLGKKRGALAGAIGGALSDFFAGAAIWILPTFFIKFVMGYICGLVLEKKPDCTVGELAGSSLGGLFQVIAYTLVKVPMVGMQPAVLSIPREIAQTVTGIVLFFVIVKALENAKVLRRRAAV